MLTRPQPSATAADLFSIPPDERFHEVVNGELIRRAMPSGKHGGAQAALISLLFSSYNRRVGGPQPGGWWLATEVEVELVPHEVYRPDVVGWRRERLAELPDEPPVTVRPDWVCEILSPSNRATDTVTKLRVYHRCKIPHYWIVDPFEETLTVLRRMDEGYLLVLRARRDETVHAEPFAEIDLHVGMLFGDEDES